MPKTAIKTKVQIGHKTILLIEDEQGISTQLVDLVNKNFPGYSISNPENWEQVRQAVLFGEFAIIIVDYILSKFENSVKLGQIEVENGMDIIKYIKDYRPDLDNARVSLYTRSNVTKNMLNEFLGGENHGVEVVEKAMFTTNGDRNLWLLRRIIEAENIRSVCHSLRIENLDSWNSTSQDLLFYHLFKLREYGKRDIVLDDNTYSLNTSHSKIGKKNTVEEEDFEIVLDYHNSLDFIIRIRIRYQRNEYEIYNLDIPSRANQLIEKFLDSEDNPKWLTRLLKHSIINNLTTWIMFCDIVPSKGEAVSMSNKKDEKFKVFGISVEFQHVFETINKILDFNLFFSISLFQKAINKFSSKKNAFEIATLWFQLERFPTIVDIYEGEISSEEFEQESYFVKLKSQLHPNLRKVPASFKKIQLENSGISGKAAFFEYINYVDSDVANSKIIPIAKFPNT